jgi:phosphoglycolate phosphatase-like HAD superfamily hydrolase
MPIRDFSASSAAATSALAALPVGAGSLVSPEALRAQHDRLNRLPPRPEPLPPRSSDNRRALDKMIEQHRAAGPGKGTFQFSGRHMGSAARVASQAYHERLPTTAPLFFSEYATEKPSLGQVAQLPRDRQDYQVVRYAGKRGQDLFTGEPIEGVTGGPKTAPLMSTQSWGTRAIRGFAATATIDQARGGYVAQLHQHIVQAIGPLVPGQVVHLVRPTRDPYAKESGLNFLTFCEQTELARTLNTLEAEAARREGRPPIRFTDNKTMISVTRTARTESTPIGRLVQQPFFSTVELRPGDQVVIADDHVETGGAVRAMEAAARSAGADVLAVATMSAHPFSPQLQMSAEVGALLDRTMASWDPDHLVMNRLAKLGLLRHTLTNSEALILIACATDPRDHAAVAAFEKLHEQFFIEAHLHNTRSPQAVQLLRQMLLQDGTGTESARSFIRNGQVLEGEHDSLLPLLRQPPQSPQETVQELDRVSRATRASVRASEPKQVVVLDWDDCLRDEKGLNYQLMHNALAVAAREQAARYPELAQAVERLQADLRSGRPAGDGDPLLMKSREEFSRHLLPRPEIFKSHVLQDFVGKMLPDVPPERAKAIHHLLRTSFNRQYQIAVQPRPGPARPQEQVPFPEVRLDLMPGAREFLEECRTAESRVVLISNRGHGDLEKEVNRLGMAHYFDVVAGASLVSRDKPAGPVPAELRQQLLAALEGGDDHALLDVLVHAVPHAAPQPQAAGLATQPPQAELRGRLRDALLHEDDAALQDALAAAAPHAHAELSRRLMASLRSGDGAALRQALGEAVAYAHPDTTRVEWADKKPGSKRLLDSLEHLSVPPQVPIVSYGDQASDVKQLAGAAHPHRRLEGVIVNAQHPSLGQRIDVDGIPTRVLGQFTPKLPSRL